ncbi:MAG: hypothetical protein ACFFD4_24160 [Candidatus Odinarchaeota archaeon]
MDGHFCLLFPFLSTVYSIPPVFSRSKQIPYKQPVSSFFVMSRFVKGSDFHLPENRDLEQYFFAKETVFKFLEAFRYVSDPTCLTTPTLGDAYYRYEERAVPVLDIDKRFDYLPKYYFFDIRFPYNIEEKVELLVVDPPFFLITLDELYECICQLAENNFKVKLVISWLRRFEREFLKKFNEFDLKPTKFQMKYQTLKPNKWRNISLYSNYDFKGIKTYDPLKKGKIPAQRFQKARKYKARKELP